METTFVTELAIGFWTKQEIYYEHADVEFYGTVVISYLDTTGNS